MNLLLEYLNLNLKSIIQLSLIIEDILALKELKILIKNTASK
jgi:hypothetical protein